MVSINRHLDGKVDAELLDGLFSKLNPQIKFPKPTRKKSKQEEDDEMAALRLYAYEDFLNQVNLSFDNPEHLIRKKFIPSVYESDNHHVHPTSAFDTAPVEEEDDSARKSILAYNLLLNRLRVLHLWTEAKVAKTADDFISSISRFTKDAIKKLSGHEPEESEVNDTTKLLQRQTFNLFFNATASASASQQHDADHDVALKEVLARTNKTAADTVQKAKGVDGVYQLDTVKNVAVRTLARTDYAKDLRRSAADLHTAQRVLMNMTAMTMQYMPVQQSLDLNDTDVAATLSDALFNAPAEIVAQVFKTMDTITALRGFKTQQVQSIVNSDPHLWKALNAAQRTDLDAIVSQMDSNFGAATRAAHPSAGDLAALLQNSAGMRSTFAPPRGY